jgi:hypothetical protein
MVRTTSHLSTKPAPTPSSTPQNALRTLARRASLVFFCPPVRWGFDAADPRRARGAAPAREIAPRAAPRCLSRCCDCRPARPLAFHAPVRSSPRPTVQLARLATSRSSVRVAGCNSRCLSHPSDRSIASSAVRGASPPPLAKESALQDARGTCSAPTNRACARSSGPRGS